MTAMSRRPSTSPCINSGSSPTSVRTEMSGASFSITGSHFVRNCSHRPKRAPIVRLARNPLATPTSWRACSTVRTSVEACFWKCRPAAVSVVPPLLRTNSVHPSVLSSVWMRALTVDCVT